ncbi:MAG: two pore domain potassium channel family protein [Planctomycetes bacterium]|nr:two pore domain potassium channel family protein [Planctomycetota bacterium]
MVVLEGPSNPDDFGSIPRAMWWAVITLTSVGYGDDVPISMTGRIFTGFYALVGVGLAGMVGGIMAAAMTETFQKRSVVDIDGEYPTDSDYQAYEIGFNHGRDIGFSGEPPNNTFLQTDKNISGYWGYEEGYQTGLNRRQEENITSQ